MTDWKINQQIFKMIGIKTDVLNHHISADCILPVVEPLDQAIRKQFYDMVYIFIPAKSYCVALVYAFQLAKDFGGLPVDYLKDPNLLLDDIYFVPYDKDPDTYDIFLKDLFWLTTPMSVKIKEYYNKEIHLEGLDENRN
jgi:hypothetical protein